LNTKGSNHIIHYWRDHTHRTTRTSSYYDDNRFMALKLLYFHKIDFDETRELVLFGAGKKAKIIAKNWVEKGISFRWTTNNPKKIGHNIYGVILEETNKISLDSHKDVVVAIASKEYKEIRQKIADQTCRTFWFC